MNNEEKILSMLETVLANQGDMGKRLEHLENDVSTLKSDVSGLKEDVATLKSDVSGLKEDVAKIEIKLEDVIEPKIELLYEGHTAIMEKLEPVMNLERRVEALESDNIVIKAAIRTLARERA